MDNYKLCYVYDGMCYFTPRKLEDQWGDDWNDRPYEHNAGAPYEEMKGKKIKIKKLYIRPITATIIEPCDGYTNSPYSVEDINNGAAPWLIIDSTYTTTIYAGTTIEEFIRITDDLPVSVYAPLKE